MNKTLIAAAALSLSAGAYAQSSVTVFGVLDVAARTVSANDQSLKLLSSDGYNSSRLGFRGVEDLGGGLKAGFWLEHGIAVDTGTQNDSARFWNRRVSVSLMGDFGEVRLGRGKTSTRLHIDDFDPFSTTGLGDVSKIYSTLGSNADSLNRSDNLVNYFLPSNLGGVYGSFDVAAGENANTNVAPGVSSGGKKLMGGRIGYKVGGLNVAGAYEQITGALNDKFKVTSLGGLYDFGTVRPSFNYSRTQFRDRKQDIYQFGLTVTVGQGLILASFGQAKANDAARTALASLDDAKIYAASYIYNLSKRTAVYTTASAIRNSGKGTYATVSNSPTPSKGGTSKGIDLGIRHSF